MTDNTPRRIYVNKVENRITFKIKIGYYLKLLTPKTMKLLECTKSKITKNKTGENAPHLKITEVVLVHCILSGIIISKIRECCIHLLL